MHKGRRIIVGLLLCMLCTACGVTRRIPDNTYLLQTVSIQDDRSVSGKERVTADDMEQYVRQTPNRRVLGINFPVWLYQHTDSTKNNWWNRWKRKLGQAPVLYDAALTERSRQNLKTYLDTRGYFTSTATVAVDTLSQPKKASVTFTVHQGEPYRIDTLTYKFEDRFLEPIVLADTAHTLLHKGGLFDIAQLDAERQRITDMLKQKGYYAFSPNNIQFVADTLQQARRVGLQMLFKQNITGYTEQGAPITENNTVYRISTINIYPDYDASVRADSAYIAQADTVSYRGLNVIYHGRPNVRAKILRQNVAIFPNYIFNTRQEERTYSNLSSLGYFRSARVAFTPLPAEPADSSSMVSYIGTPVDSTVHLTKEGYLRCDIFATPSPRHNFRIDLTGSTTSNFYALRATLGYQNRNIFHGAELLDVSFTTGYEFMKAHTLGTSQKKRASEYGGTVSLTFPRFLLPWHTNRYLKFVQPKTKIELSVNYQDRPYYRRTISSASIAYMWSNNRFSSFSVSPLTVNVIDVHKDMSSDFFQNMIRNNNKYLLNSFNTQFAGGLSFGYTYNNQPRNLNGNATVIRFNFETAGNLIDAVEHAFYPKPADGAPYSIFGIDYAQYFRTDISVSRKIMLGSVTAVAGRLYGGVGMAYGNSVAIPFDRQFYAGGGNSMRGWSPRALGQGSVANPNNAFPMQTGDVKLEANLELRFPIWGLIHGATFFDLGNIWYIRSDPEQYSDDAVFKFNNFYKQLGFNTGLGIRIDIKFAVLRLDWGIQLHNPNNPSGERWIHNFKWKNTALNFGVGYPF